MLQAVSGLRLNFPQFSLEILSSAAGAAPRSNICGLPGYIDTDIIAYSLHAICCPNEDFHWRLDSLDFESGSELRSIGTFPFQKLALKSVFIPRSVNSIRSSAFLSCDTVVSVIPASVTEIVGFASFLRTRLYVCRRLRSATFGLPFSGWYFLSGI
jgi:hypothetical protein